jgi:hypothetical protein
VADDQPGTAPRFLALMALALLATVLVAVVAVQQLPTIEFGTGLPETGSDPAALTPGVHATITVAGRTIEKTMSRLDIRLENGESVDEELPAGPFDATFVVVFTPGQARQAYVGAEIQGGQLIVRRNDRILLSDFAGRESRRAMSPFPISLAARQQEIVYEFSATGDGPYTIRALWRSMEWLEPRPLFNGGATSSLPVANTRFVRGAAPMEDRPL